MSECLMIVVEYAAPKKRCAVQDYWWYLGGLIGLPVLYGLVTRLWYAVTKRPVYSAETMRYLQQTVRVWDALLAHDTGEVYVMLKSAATGDDPETIRIARARQRKKA